MKKLTFVLLVAATMLAAAPLFAEGMMFGIKGGINLANLTGDDVEDNSMKIGGVGGGFLCYRINEIFAIQPEILFSMKGADFEAPAGDTLGMDGSFSLNYIEIPLLLKVNLPTEGKMKPFLYAGPAFGLLMTAKVEDVDVKDDMKTMDIGILAGAGIGYQMEGGTLFFEARYEVGMTSVPDDDDVDAKNTAISFMVGYGFAF